MLQLVLTWQVFIQLVWSWTLNFFGIGLPVPQLPNSIWIQLVTLLRARWSREFLYNPQLQWVIHLRCDSSPQFSKDYLVAERDYISLESVYSLTPEQTLSALTWSSRVLPIQVLGRKATSVPFKFKALMRMLHLETGNIQAARRNSELFERHGCGVQVSTGSKSGWKWDRNHAQSFWELTAYPWPGSCDPPLHGRIVVSLERRPLQCIWQPAQHIGKVLFNQTTWSGLDSASSCATPRSEVMQPRKASAKCLSQRARHLSSTAGATGMKYSNGCLQDQNFSCGLIQHLLENLAVQKTILEIQTMFSLMSSDAWKFCLRTRVLLPVSGALQMQCACCANGGMIWVVGCTVAIAIQLKKTPVTCNSILSLNCYCLPFVSSRYGFLMNGKYRE